MSVVIADVDATKKKHNVYDSSLFLSPYYGSWRRIAPQNFLL